MSIQFTCPGCSQPIEVDDENAGQTATCPYCRKVVNIPAESTLNPAAATSARPLGSPAASAALGEPRSAPLGLHVGPTLTNRQRAGITYGNYGLMCCVLTLLCFGATTLYGFSALFKELGVSPTSRSFVQPTEEEMAQALDAVAAKHPWLAAGPLGGGFFAVVGLVLGIASLKHRVPSNWRAIITLVICGTMTFCCFSGALMKFIGP